ncbi:hypothetical protein TRV_02552 [Trichophyton verrucosum HKI 0517]|uniref:Uncharacterized protein n=1 Tax=Trichophyton verrucosum (strain HKI 0517) TaxID=663202 RepID=D4D629_TRIVH|nr:uncharacterized protein TRV_02552 [Trichophyton verrucosum HKI 0517]EFE42708.1 hypothetical protein TRV_02552 [Trichophyton verrucosum HKI 0517]
MKPKGWRSSVPVKRSASSSNNTEGDPDLVMEDTEELHHLLVRPSYESIYADQLTRVGHKIDPDLRLFLASIIAPDEARRDKEAYLFYWVTYVADPDNLVDTDDTSHLLLFHIVIGAVIMIVTSLSHRY